MDGSDSPEKHLKTADMCREEGNGCLNKGDYAEACCQYEAGLLSLAKVVGKDLEQRVEELRSILHLNASLAHLRRGNLRSAADHASGALAIDANNEKGLFRRGSALSKLSEHTGHEKEAQNAIADFKRVVKMNPENLEAVRQLRLLEKLENKDKRSMEKACKNMFGSGASPLYDTPAQPTIVPPAIYTKNQTQDGSHQTRIEVEKVAFHYSREEQVLKGVNLELKGSRCVGLFGNNASGKSTLARLLKGQLRPVSGRITHCGGSGQADLQASGATEWLAGARSLGKPGLLSMGIAVLVAMIAIMFAVAARVAQGQSLSSSTTRVLSTMNSINWIYVGVATLCALCCCAFYGIVVSPKSGGAQHSVVYVSSEASDKEEIAAKKTILQVIGEKLPKHLSPDERKQRVIAMLRAAGFCMYNQDSGEQVGCPEEYVRDGLKYGVLSGGQKHLMYVLRSLASYPDVLVCDELLGGLDAIRQPRVLHMLRRMKEEMHTSILYITTELSQLKLICDDIGYLSGGVMSELGPADDVLDCPKHPDCKEYVNSYRSLPGCQIIGGKLAQNFTEIAGDADIAGKWLPV